MLTEKQQKIYEWLYNKLQLPVYAKAYKGAVHLLKEKRPGYITFISHTGRDIMNGLARTVAGSTGSQVEYQQLVDNLQKKWQDEWRGQGLSPAPHQEVGHLIPYDVCEMITGLIEKHKEGRNRPQKADDFFFDTFLGYSDKNKITNLEKWKKAKLFFREKAHLRKGDFSEEVPSEVEENFETLEEFLYIAATSEYSRIGSLDAILEGTNE